MEIPLSIEKATAKTVTTGNIIPYLIFHFHELSHTYAVNAIRAGDDFKTLQENLGHATAVFTMQVYGHVTEQMKRTSADRMEQFMKGISGL